MRHSSFVLRIQVVVLVVLLQAAFHYSFVAAQSTTPPSVFITSPSNKGVLHGIVTVSVQASSPNGIASVEVFYSQGVVPQDIPPGPKVQGPYTWNWNTSAVDNGTYTLRAQAFDINGNNATSTPITVSVANGPSSAPALTPGSIGLLVVVLALAAVGVMVLYRRRSRSSLSLPRTNATQFLNQ